MSLWSWIDDNIIQPVIKNPVGVLVNVGLMAMGVPPIAAAAAGGAANAAVNGQDILKGAVTGGAMAYVGGAAANAVAGAGYGQALSGAAGGAASGATGALLTGGNIVQGALTGGVVGGTMGGITQYLAGSGAVNPAAAGSQMTRAEYAASIPDDVLAEAIKTSDPVAYVNKQMGFTGQGTSAGGVNDALADYRMASTPAAPAGTYSGNASVTPVAPVDINTALAAANAPGVVDPLGTLINQMQWTPAAAASVTSSVADAYGQKTAEQLAADRLSKLSAQQQSNMNVRVPGLMSEAQNNANIDTILSQSSDPATLMKKLGWSDNQFTQEAAQRLIDDYKATGTAQQTLANQQAEYIRTHQTTAPTTNANGGIDLGPVSPEVSNMTTDQVNQAISNGTTPSVTPVAPVNTVDIGGGNYMDQYGNIVDVNGNVTQAAVQPGPAAPPTASNEIRVDVGGTPAYADSPNTAVQQYRTPGTNLATAAEINNGSAVWNAQANSWEVPTSNQQLQELTPVDINDVGAGGRWPGVTNVDITNQAPVPVESFDFMKDGVLTTFTRYSDGGNTQIPKAQTPQPAGPGSAVVTPQVPINTSSTITPGTTQPTVPVIPPTVPSTVTSSTGTPGNVVVTPQVPVNTGSTITSGTTAPTSSTGTAGNVVVTPQVPVNTGSTVTQGSSTGTSGNVVVTPQVPINTGSTITPGTEQPLTPLQPGNITPSTPVTNVDVSSGGTGTTDTIIHNPDPVVVIPPTTPETPKGSSTHYGTYEWGKGPELQIPTGLNPGWIQPTDFYATTSPVQSHYYWGGHPYQAGPTFNPTTYNAVPNAPGTPWGLQQMFNPNYNYPVTQYMPPQQYLPVAP